MKAMVRDAYCDPALLQLVDISMPAIAPAGW